MSNMLFKYKVLDVIVQRFLVENHGPNIDAFKVALVEAIKFSQANSINQITLVVPNKGSFPHTVVGEFFGEKASKMLCKGDALDLGDGISMTLEIPRNVASHKIFGLALAVYLSEKDIRVIDTVRSVRAIVYVPWIEEDGKKWLAMWSPIKWGKSSWTVTQLSFSTEIETALTSLTKRINLSTGLGHPSDKEAAKRMLSKLKSDKHQVLSEDIEQWAIKNGWQARHAEELGKLAAKYFK